MSLKPIPIEILREDVRQKMSVIQQIRLNLDKTDTSRQEEILKASAIRLADYLSSPEKFSSSEISALIRGLERSSIYLQKRRNLLSKEEHDKANAKHKFKKSKNK